MYTYKYRYDYEYEMHHSDEYDTIAIYIWEMSGDEIEFNAINHYETWIETLEFRADVMILEIDVIHYTIVDGVLRALIDVTYEITEKEE